MQSQIHRNMHISVVSTVNANQVYVPQAEPERYLKD